jgi:hypothetical protein
MAPGCMGSLQTLNIYAHEAFHLVSYDFQRWTGQIIYESGTKTDLNLVFWHLKPMPLMNYMSGDRVPRQATFTYMYWSMLIELDALETSLRVTLMSLIEHCSSLMHNYVKKQQNRQLWSCIWRKIPHNSWNIFTHIPMRHSTSIGKTYGNNWVI